MEQTRFLKITIIILLLINLGTLGFLLTRRPPPPPRDGMHHNAGEYLEHELKFTPQQEQQLEELRDEHHLRMEQLNDENRKFHDRFFDLLKSADSARINTIADSMAAIQKQIELTTFNHFKKVRAICTVEQQEKFDDIIDDAMRMMAPRQQGPPPER